MKKTYLLVSLMLLTASCETDQSTQPEAESQAYETTGSLESLDPSFANYVADGAEIEVLADGFVWSEGPVWIEEGQFLLFSDIPPNKIWRWSEAEGLSEWLMPSGYTSDVERTGEVGSNGLILDHDGNLVLAQHGDRRIARLSGSVLLDEVSPDFQTIADQYDGKRLNSPNDVVIHSNGDYYFTDPPYGLEFRMEDPSKEIDFQGVYRVDSEGAVHLLSDELSRPNGLGFSPDEQTLYVANSDPDRAIWMAYDVLEDGSVNNGRVFFDASSLSGPDRRGLPDGLKVAKDGTIYATGPGGVLVLSPGGVHLGTILTGHATANCAFNADESMLYMTADDYLMRIAL